MTAMTAAPIFIAAHVMATVQSTLPMVRDLNKSFGKYVG